LTTCFRLKPNHSDILIQEQKQNKVGQKVLQNLNKRGKQVAIWKIKRW
jgi:hypothetical protein